MRRWPQIMLTVATEDDTSVSGNVITNDSGSGVDSDIDAGSSLSIPATGLTVTTTNGVTLTLGSDGSFTYPIDTAANNSLSATESVTDSFTYTVTDGTLTDTATVTITIAGVNDAPIPTPNAYAVGEDASLTGNVITDDTGAGTDTDPESDPLSIPASATTVTAASGIAVSLGTDGTFTYTPGTIFQSLSSTDAIVDSFIYTVSDGVLSATETVFVTVLGANDAPVATDNGYSILENASVSGNLITDDTGSGTDFDVDVPSTISITAVTPDAGTLGSLSFSSDGSFTYAQGTLFDTLAVGATYAETFTYTLTDDQGATGTATLTIMITGVNDAPVATDNDYTTNENGIVVQNAIRNDAGHGRDSGIDNPSQLGILGGPQTLTSGAGVTFSITESGRFTYDPGTVFDSLAAGATINDSFSYSIEDDQGATDSAIVTITIRGLNDAPVATDNAYTVLENASVNGNLITDDTGSGTDFDVDVPSTISITAVTPDAGTLGSLSFSSDGSFTYAQGTLFDSLAAGATHAETFTYTLTDDQGATDTATLTITITGESDAPVATDNDYTILENASVSGNLITDDTGSGTDFDVDVPSTISITAVTPDAGTLGSLSFSSDGSFTYAQGTLFDTLAVGATYAETFTYTLTDDQGATGTATLTIMITGVNDAPVATDNDYTTNENGIVVQNAIRNDAGHGRDSGIDNPSQLGILGGPQTLTSGAGVTFSITESGRFTYDPGTVFDSLAAGATINDSFSYSIEDDQGATDSAIVTITIRGLNDAPVATDNAYTVLENASVNGNLITDDTGSGTDFDVDVSSTISITSVTPDAGTLGSLSFSSDGSFTYAQGTLFDSLAAGATHAETFTYTLTDDQGATDTATLTITITGESDAPVATDNAYTVLENASVNGNLITDDTGNGTDFDVNVPSTIGVTAVTPAQGTLGSVSFNSDGSFTYIQGTLFDSLAAGATHAETFTYTLTDDQGATDTATLTITITGVNDAPVATDNAYTVLESGAIGPNVFTDDSGSGTDFDIDAGDFFFVSGASLSPGFLGLWILMTDGSFTYDPNGNFESLGAGETATEGFSYTISDGSGATDSATVTITIVGENDALVARDNTYTTTENALANGNVITDNTGQGVDSDIDVNDTLSINGGAQTVATTGGGVVSLASDGSFTYDPGTNYDSLAAGVTDTDSFSYVATDGTATSSANVTITVTGVNDAPIARDNAYTTTENSTLGGNVITDSTGQGVDSDVDASDTLSIDGGAQTVATTGGGVVSLASDGSFTYDPGTNYDSLAATSIGTDSFSYTVTDGTATSSANVSLTITGANDAPVATDNAYTVLESGAIGPNVFTDDSGSGTDFDIDAGDFFFVSGASLSPGFLGLWILMTDGSFTYDPNGNFESLGAGETATEGFSYTISDGSGATDSATVTITIVGENDALVARDNTYTTTENALANGNVITDNTGQGVDSDIDVNDTLSINGGAQTVATTGGGVVSLASDGSFTYDPGTNYDSLAAGVTDTDSFSYVATDGTATSSANVTITVTGVNDAPIARDNAYTTTENGTLGGNVITDSTGQGVDSDVDASDTLSIDGGAQTVATTGGGVVSLASDGSFTYDPGTNYDSLAATSIGTDSFSYTVTDGTATSSANVSLTITGANDAPVATDNAYTVLESGAIGPNVFTDDSGSGTDFDIDVGDFFFVSGASLSPGFLGLWILMTDGSFTYDPNGNFESLGAGETATEGFSYTISDGAGATDSATVTITIVGENDALVARDNTYTTTENALANGNVITDNTGQGVDSDIDVNDTLSINGGAQTVATTGGGVVSLASDGSFTYDPGTNYDSLVAGATATDSFSYVATDGTATSSANVTITVTGVNDAPVAQDDNFTDTENVVPLPGNLFIDNGNGADFDIDGNAFSIANVGVLTTAQGGTVTLSATGAYTYIKGGFANSLGLGETVADTFTYTITDGSLTDTALVTFTITGLNDTPQAEDNEYTITENATVGGNVITDDTGQGVDSDDDTNDTLSIDGGAQTLLSNGGAVVSLASDGSFTYDPGTNYDTLAAGVTDTDSFSYVATDGTATSSANVIIKIAGVNDAPVATDNNYTALEGVPTSGNLFTDDTGAGTDSDIETPSMLTITNLSANGGVGGFISLATTTGAFTYTQPSSLNTLAAGETSMQQYIYTITDAQGGTDSATLSIIITGVNDEPVATDNAYSTTENATVGGNVITDDTGQGVDSDDDTNDTLSIDGGAQTLLSNGGAVVSLASDGSFTYDPGTNYDTLAAGVTDTDEFVYRITDGIDTSNNGKVTITITGEALDQINEIGIANAETPDGVINEDFVELHNSMTDAAQDLGGLEIQLTGVTDGSTTSFIIPEGIATPPAGFFTVYGNGEYALFDSTGLLTDQGIIPGVSWDFADTNGDGFVDTRDAIGINFKVANSTAVIDTFVANGASFAEQKWNPVAMPTVAMLSGILIDGFNGQIGDQQGLLDTLGIGRPSVSGAGISAAASGSTFAKHTDVPGAENPSNQTAWNVTDTATPGDFNNSSSLNPQDASDDLDPGQANTDPLAGQNIIELEGSDNAAVTGGHGNDFILGDSRDNILYGGANNDFISGGEGNDQLYGEGGADLLYDNLGSDYLVGGSGDDTLIATASILGGSDPAETNAQGRDVLIGDAVIDGAATSGDATGSDVIFGGAHNDIIFGDNVYIDFDALAALPGNGDAESLRAAYADDPIGFVHAHLSSDSYNNSIDSLGTRDWIDAGAGDDLINGQGGDDEILAGAGNDTVWGGAGNDSIDGGSGADTLSAGIGDDILIFDSLDASIDGGLGHDTLRFNQAGESLDFAAVHPDISNIEAIDLEGTGANSVLNLTPDDVAAITGEANVLHITGNGDGDSISGSGWGEGVIGENTTTYTDGIRTLIVDNDIDQSLLS